MKTSFAFASPVLQSSGQADSERAAHAMADPEIQMILTDPVVRQVLNDFKENPQHAQKVWVVSLLVSQTDGGVAMV